MWSADLIAAIAALSGSLIAALSVFYAVRNYNKNLQLKMIDQVRLDSVELKGHFRELDRSISGAFFLEVAEKFGERVDILVGEEKTKENLSNYINYEGTTTDLLRALTLSVEECDSVAKSKILITDIRRLQVRVSQTFPISSALIDTCVSLTESTALALTSPHVFSQVLDGDAVSKITEDIFPNSYNYQCAIKDFSAVFSDIPMQLLGEHGQLILSECRKLVYHLCDMLTNMDYHDLRNLSEKEGKKISDFDFVNSGYAEDIDNTLLFLKPIFGDKKWNDVWESRTRLIGALSTE